MTQQLRKTYDGGYTAKIAPANNAAHTPELEIAVKEEAERLVREFSKKGFGLSTNNSYGISLNLSNPVEARVIIDYAYWREPWLAEEIQQILREQGYEDKQKYYGASDIAEIFKK